MPQPPRDRRRLLLVVMAATGAALAAAIGGLLLGSAHTRDAMQPPQAPVPATAHPTAPSTPGDPPVAKPAVAIQATVTPAESAPSPAKETAAASKSDSTSGHAKAYQGRHRLKARRLAHVEGPSKRAKGHPHARLGRKPARTHAAAAPASGADAATRSRAAYQEGNAKLFAGDTATAIEAYLEAIRLNRKDPAGHRGLGLAYTQAGKRTEAASAFSRYLKLARTAKDRDIITERIRLLNSQ